MHHGLYWVIAATVTVLTTGCARTPDPSPVPKLTQDPSPTVELTRGPYSVAQLRSWHEHLGQGGIWNMAGVVSTGVNEWQKRVEIGVECEENREAARRAMGDLLSKLNIPADAVAVVSGSSPSMYPGPRSYPCVPRETVDPVTGLSSPGFGGMFVDADVVYVYLLEPSGTEAQRLVHAAWGEEPPGKPLDVRVLQGQYTWEQLLEWYELLRSKIPEVSPLFVWESGALTVDERRNRVTLDVTGIEGATPAELEASLARLDFPREALVFLERVDGDLVEVK